MTENRVLKVKIEGLEPGYMQSRLDPYDLLKDASGKKATGGGEPKDPENLEFQAHRKLYLNDKKQPCIPAQHIYGSLLNAAKDFKIQGRRGKSYREVFASSVKVAPELIPITPPTWEIDLKAANNPRAGRIPVVRPKFPAGWTAEFVLNIEDEQITDETVKRVLEHAGTNKGIGSYRPTNEGPYGRFLVRTFDN